MSGSIISYFVFKKLIRVDIVVNQTLFWWKEGSSNTVLKKITNFSALIVGEIILKPVILLGCYIFNFTFKKIKLVMVDERD